MSAPARRGREIARPELFAGRAVEADQVPFEIFLLARLFLVEAVAAVASDDDLVADHNRATEVPAPGIGVFQAMLLSGAPGDGRAFIRRDA